MKGIAGTGSLAVPCAVKSVDMSLLADGEVGIVWAFVLFIIVSCAYVYSSHPLITMNNSLGAKKNVEPTRCHEE